MPDLPRAGDAPKKTKRGNWRSFVYLSIWPWLQDLCHSNGYMATFHGSFIHDLDIILVPWQEDVVSPDELISLITAKYAQITNAPFESITGPTYKPHRRMAWMLEFHAGMSLDISIMPPNNYKEDHYA